MKPFYQTDHHLSLKPILKRSRCLFSFLALVLLMGQSCTSTKSLTKAIPSDIDAVMDHHGGMQEWNRYKSMSYEIVKEKGNEKQMVNLHDRRERIEGSNFTMGYDGNDYWVEADTSFKTNPVFYKNLMFYFYAMPFVLGDPGIHYSPAQALEFEGTRYPGYRISYASDVGVSPEDEYFIHYHPSTKEMAWLGYTVTYFSKEKSTQVKWIRYDEWDTYEGLRLPKSLSWYKVEEGKPTTLRNKVDFANVTLGLQSFPEQTFKPTSGAKTMKE